LKRVEDSTPNEENTLIEVREKTRQYIIQTFLFGDGNKLADDISFLKNSIIDSTGMLELIRFIEEEFGMSIDDGELIPENLDSIDNIVSFVTRKKG
jgi:acyl carrier protein